MIKGKGKINLPLILAPSGAIPIIFMVICYLNEIYQLKIFHINLNIDSFIINYCIAILAFISGINWGFATRSMISDGNMNMSVLSNFLFLSSNLITIAAVSISLAEGFLLKILLITLLFYFQLFIDLKIACHLPEWFKYMRIVATLLITTPLLVLLIALQ